jgi:hypothetical protein
MEIMWLEVKSLIGFLLGLWHTRHGNVHQGFIWHDPVWVLIAG